MKFEVIDQHSKVLMHTEHPEAVYSENELKEMAGAGYRFRLDGKIVSAGYIMNVLSYKPSTSGTKNKKLF